MENKQAIIDNLEALLTAVKAQPEHLFNLDTFRKEEPCGTLFCVAGLAATMPVFQEMGMGWSAWGTPVVNDVSVFADGGDVLFGIDSMDDLFNYAGGSWNDIMLGWRCTVESHKELAIARLEHRIATYKASLESA